jgi:glycosyltransferase involved in cell wall biosynthesis
MWLRDKCMEEMHQSARTQLFKEVVADSMPRGHEDDSPCDCENGSAARVLLIGPSPPPYNGMSVATQLVLSALSGITEVVRLDTADRRGIANIGRFELGNLWLAARHGAENLWLLLTRHPKIVYVPISQSWLPFFRDCLFLIPAKLSGRKVIVHLHGGYFGEFYRNSGWPLRALIRFSLGRVFVAIVLGEGVANVFDGVIPRERIRIAPNGIPDYFAGRLNGRPHLEAPTLLYLGALDEQKGFLDVLRALPEIRKRTGEFRVVLAGAWYSERDKRAAEQLIRDFDLAEYVQFVGPVESDRKESLLALADIFVLPSRNEGQPYAILEALAAGLPIISSSVGCIPETVREGVEGFLVEPRDIESLAKRMELLIRDEILRESMGLAARRRFLEKYTYEQFSSRMRSIFAEALAGR